MKVRRNVGRGESGRRRRRRGRESIGNYATENTRAGKIKI